MANVAVIAATGGIGRLVTAQLLDETDHLVRAVVRSPGKIPGGHARLGVHGADVTDTDALHAALNGVDVVVSCLGNDRGRDPVTATGTANLLDAMGAHGIERLAVISSVGIGDSRDQATVGLADRLALAVFRRLVVPLALRSAFDDLEQMEALVVARCPQGVRVRPTGLTDRARTDRYTVASPSEPVRAQISRADVAAFLVRWVDDPRWDGRAVSLGG